MDTKKAKKKLSDFSFEKEGCHISLVGPSMGGAANGYSTLTLKSLSPQGINSVPKGEGKQMEMIEKSAADVMVQKAVDEATATLKAEGEVLKAASQAKDDKERKDKLVAVLGTEGADGMEVAVKSLDDSAFEIVLKGLAAAKEAESKSDMFKEKGVNGDVKKDAPVEEDTAKRLEAKIKSQFAAK